MKQGDSAATLRENVEFLLRREALTKRQLDATLDMLALESFRREPGGSLKKILESYNASLPSPSSVCTVNLCRALLRDSELKVKAEELLSQGLEDTPAGAHGKIAYAKNKFTDLAFEKLSLRLSNAKAIHLPSFSDACEALNDGVCEFAILPLGNTIDGKLFGVYTMIDRYGLKICGVCDVDTDENRTVRYALLAKKTARTLQKRAKNLGYLLEFSLISRNADFLSELGSGIDKCGAVLISVDSRPVPYDHQLKKYIFSLNVQKNDLELLKLWLTLSYESFSLIGFYPQSEEGTHI